MRRIIIAFFVLLSGLCLAACASSKDTIDNELKAKDEVIVFAAASLTEPLNSAINNYEKANPDIHIVVNYESSGTLKTQIKEGAPCDIFISAGQKAMDQIDINADAEINTEGLDLVVSDSRFDILENQVVLCSSKGSSITSFDELKEAFENENVLFEMGNSDVPVGQYTSKIISFMGLDEQKLAQAGLISYAGNSKEVTAAVANSVVDCAVTYKTDAFSAGLSYCDIATEEMCGRCIYPAALIKTGSSLENARSFLRYLTSEDAQLIFNEVGFETVLQGIEK